MHASVTGLQAHGPYRPVRHCTNATATASAASETPVAGTVSAPRQHAQHHATEQHLAAAPARALLQSVTARHDTPVHSPQLHEPAIAAALAQQPANISLQLLQGTQQLSCPIHHHHQQQQQQHRPDKLPKQLHAVHQQMMIDIRSKRLLQKGQKLLVVATSNEAGTCLAGAMTDISGAWGWHLVIAHLSNINGTSTSSTIPGSTWTKEFQAASHVLHAASMTHLHITSAGSPGSQALLTQLQTLAAEHACTAIVLPTTATDCASQLLMEMLRGQHTQQVFSNGIPTTTQHPAQMVVPAWKWRTARSGAVTMVQPLLRTTEQQVQHFVAQHNLAHLHRSTHQIDDSCTTCCEIAAGGESDCAYVRQSILPFLRTHFNPATDVALSRTAMLLHEDAEFLTTPTLTFLGGAEPAAAAAAAQPTLQPAPTFAAAASTRLASTTQLLSSAGASMCSNVLEFSSLIEYRNNLAGSDQPHLMSSSNQRQQTVDDIQQQTAHTTQHQTAHDAQEQVEAIRQHVLSRLQCLPHQLRDVQHVLVAVSGGQDSLCLLWLVLSLQSQLGWKVYVVHCDHRWRVDSADNAQHVATVCQQWGVPCHIRVASDHHAISTEARARTWRYNMLWDVAKATGCELVLTGHTLTDVVETQLLNLCRGSGPAGLQALQHVRRLVPEQQPEAEACPYSEHVAEVAILDPSHTQGASQQHVWVARPLLELRRGDTGFMCQQLQLPVYLDSTNDDVLIARRNRVRLQLMPMLARQFGSNVEQQLVAFGSAVAGSASAMWLEAVAHVAAATALIRHEPSLSFDRPAQFEPGSSWSLTHTWALDRMFMCKAPVAIQRRIVITLLSTVPGLAAHLRFDKVEQVLQLMGAPNGSSTGTLAHVPLELVLTSRNLAICASLNMDQRCAVSAVVHQKHIVIVFARSTGKTKSMSTENCVFLCR